MLALLVVLFASLVLGGSPLDDGTVRAFVPHQTFHGVRQALDPHLAFRPRLSRVIKIGVLAFEIACLNLVVGATATLTEQSRLIGLGVGFGGVRGGVSAPILSPLLMLGFLIFPVGVPRVWVRGPDRILSTLILMSLVGAITCPVLDSPFDEFCSLYVAG